MQSRWPFFFATLLLFLITFMSLQVWVQEQTKVRQALLESASRKPASAKNNSQETKRSPRFQSASSDVTTKVRAEPYTPGQRSPFRLPAASFDVYDDSPNAEPAGATRNFNPGPPEDPNAFNPQPLDPPEESMPEEAILVELGDNPWTHDADPDLNEEPNSPRNNLEKLAELLPPPETGTLPDSLDLADQSFQIDQDFNRQSNEEPAPNPIVKFASTAKMPEPKLLSTIGPPRRPPSQPLVEIEIPEWDPHAAWPKPTAILKQLEEFQKYEATKQWTVETTQLLKLLHWTKSIDDPNATVIFEQLSKKLNELDNICVQISTAHVQLPEYSQGYLAGKLRTFRYDIARRIVLWLSLIHISEPTRPY